MSFPKFKKNIALRCPNCQSFDLTQEDEWIICLACGRKYKSDAVIEQNSEYINENFFNSYEKDIKNEIIKEIQTKIKGFKK